MADLRHVRTPRLTLDPGTGADLDDLPAAVGTLAPGALVGTGGCAVRAGTDWWTLQQVGDHRQLGTQRAGGVQGGGHQVGGQPVAPGGRREPVVEHDAESRGRAERSGLTCSGAGRTPATPTRPPSDWCPRTARWNPDLLGRIAAGT